MQSKRGSFEGIVYIVGGAAILIFCAFIFIFGSSILNFMGDTITPIFDDIGMAGDVNVTFISKVALHPVNSIIQSMTWFGTILFIFGILALFGVAFVYRSVSERWLIPLFWVMMLVLVLVCIIFSNMYQDFLAGTDDISSIMNEYSGLNYFILYSPAIMAIIGFIAGVIMFTGSGNEENTT
jgi:hypothetical protein